MLKLHRLKPVVSGWMLLTSSRDVEAPQAEACGVLGNKSSNKPVPELPL